MTQMLIEYQLIEDQVKNLFNIDLKDIQTEAIHSLIFQKSDLILIAKTGFGKSIIFQATPLLIEQPGICLILMPLKALEKEQCRKLDRIALAKPLVLDGDSNTDSNRRKIREGLYTHGMNVSRPLAA